MFTYNVTINRIVDGDTAKVDIDLGFGIVYSNQTIRFWGCLLYTSDAADE